MPNSDIAMAIDAPMIEQSTETRASSSSLIDIARVIHASDYAPRTVPRRRLPRRTGGTPAQQVALRDGLRKWAGYDATMAANRFPHAPAHQVRSDVALLAILHQGHPNAGKSLEVLLVVDDKGYMDIAPDLLHLLLQDPFASADLRFCKWGIASTWHNDVGTSCLIGRHVWDGACALRREKECRLLRKRRPPSLVPDVFAAQFELEPSDPSLRGAIVPAYELNPVPTLFPGMMEHGGGSCAVS